MLKIIKIPGGEIIAEKNGKLWYARYKDTLIVMPTIRELKQAMQTIFEHIQKKYN